jgi:hypothetical protein
VESLKSFGPLITSYCCGPAIGGTIYLRTRIIKDNTVGSQSKVNLAYIAGFLDGDGSLMLQIKKRKDGKSKRRFMCTICFYQDSRHEKSLYWIRKILGIGYLSRRNDGMSELRINGFKQVRDIIKDLLPFIRFKRVQAKSMLKAADLLTKKIGKLSKNDLLKLINYIITIQDNNYVTKRKKSKKDLLTILGLTP